MHELNNCEEIQDQLSPFIDGELPKDEILQVAEHLMVCEKCQKEYYSLKQTSFHIQNYFDSYNNTVTLKKFDIKNIIFKAKVRHFVEIATSSVAVIAVFGLLSWFSINTFETKFIQDKSNNKEYVNAESYMMLSLLDSPENVSFR